MNEHGEADRVSAAGRAEIERTLAEAELTLIRARARMGEFIPDGAGGFSRPANHPFEILVPTVVGAVGTVLRVLITEARAQLWPAETLRLTADTVVGQAVGRFEPLQEQFWTVEAFRTHIGLAVRDSPEWLELLRVVQERSAAPPSLADQLRYWKKQCRLTVRKLGTLAGLHPDSVQDHLKGKVPPRPENIESYERVFSERSGRPVKLIA